MIIEQVFVTNQYQKDTNIECEQNRQHDPDKVVELSIAPKGAMRTASDFILK